MLTDIMMPNMDGVELCNKVESLYSYVKLQLMSGFSDELHTHLNNQAHYTNRLIKPFSFAELLVNIGQLLDQTDVE
jgi:YesN/AraC family two-component response regulator